MAACSQLRKLWCARILRVIGLRLRVHGTPPQRGVIIGNHLSYLDILTCGAVLDGIFVSKREVRSWPLIGLITRLAGTVYVNRSDRSTSAQAIDKMIAANNENVSVTFFPEGTTSDGSSVLRFRAALFDAPLRTGTPVWPSAIAYTIAGRQEGVADLVCYWGDMVFGPHMLRFLRLRDVVAHIRFGAETIHGNDRFEMAQTARAAVAQLAGLRLAPPGPTHTQPAVVTAPNATNLQASSF